MPSIARYERAAVADLLEAVGPDAPTLCEGWDARDLAAHLVVRERRADAAPGIVLRPLSGHTESVQRSYAERPFEVLVHLVRTGPGRLSWLSLPKADRFLNTTEYFVHHEDLRRAQTGWSARVLPDRVQEALWKAVKVRGMAAFRGAGCGVVLRRTGGDEVTASHGEPVAVVTGEPQELLLYVFGRRGHALVDVSGPEQAQEMLRGADTQV
ncbi:MAG: TIGR03085 family metal-binding protein [Actinomycetes bacterium]